MDWDEKGNVIATAIATGDEYLIDTYDKGEETFSLLHEEVEISGWCRKKGGKKMVVIKTYRQARGETDSAVIKLNE